MSTPSILLASLLVAVAPSDRVPLAGGGSLQWDAPAETCPDPTTVGALIDQHLAPRGEAAAGVRVDARARGAPGSRWRIELRIETGQGASQRSLEAADCRAAAETVALAVALAVGPAAEGPPVEVPPAPELAEATDDDPQTPDPSAQTPDPSPQTPDPSPQTPDPSAQTPDPSPQTPDPSSQTPDPNPATSDARPPARGLAFDLALGGGLTFGHIARLGGAAQAQVALVGRRFQVSLRADHLVRRRVSFADLPEAGGLLSFTTGALEAGPVLRPGPVELPLLAGVAVGAVRARGFGSDLDRTRTVPWAAVIVGPGVRWAPLPRLVLGLRAELSIALVRHSFTFGPDATLATTGLVAGHAFATIGLRLP